MPEPDGFPNRAVVARDLVLGYGTREVLKGVDFHVPSGQFLVLLGPSGSGKTTLLMALNGSIPLRSGSLEVLGARPSGLLGAELERFREKIGFIFQALHVFVWVKY
jgi:ABC-type transporter Mla maintaining outer membrane lipid asymmetry ATPase subunit MlaF